MDDVLKSGKRIEFGLIQVQKEEYDG